MPAPIDPQAFLNLCDLSIDSIYELEALGELLEKKGLLTKQDILALAKDLKQKGTPTESTDLSQQPFTAQGNAVIEQLTEIILRPSQSVDHAKSLITKNIQLLEWGKQAANEMPEANA